MKDKKPMTKTVEAKLVAARALVAKYEQQIASAAIVNNIEVNDTVTIKFGRGDKVRHVTGKVVGTADTDAGKLVAVLDAELNTFKVNARDILSNPDADARNAIDADPAAAAEIVASSEELVAESSGIAAADPLSFN